MPGSSENMVQCPISGRRGKCETPMRKLIGAITIGQSPRDDVVPEMEALLDGVTFLQSGVLDGLTKDEIAALAPTAGEELLVSRLRDGGWVRMGEGKILPIVQRRIDALQKQGVELIVLLCTGKFPDVFCSQMPLIFPQRLLYGVAPHLAEHIGVVNPDAGQLAQCRENWGAVAKKVTAVSANPYEGAAGLEDAAARLVEAGAQICVLDCIGYSREMKERLRALTGLPVILPRTLLARVLAEMTD